MGHSGASVSNRMVPSPAKASELEAEVSVLLVALLQRLGMQRRVGSFFEANMWKK